MLYKLKGHIRLLMWLILSKGQRMEKGDVNQYEFKLHIIDIAPYVLCVMLFGVEVYYSKVFAPSF